MKAMKRSVMMVLGGSLLLGGCSSSNLVGTWRASGESGEGFSVAEATFRDDGSYSAEVVEGGREISDSGQWSKRGKKLELQGERATRTYEARVRGAELIMTDPETGQSVTLEREAPGG
jgi:osmotically-inducible protein OsmY